MQSEAEGAAHPSKLKQIAIQALDVLGSGAGRALGGFVSAQLTTFLGMLG